jgi:hypothetical protein
MKHLLPTLALSAILTGCIQSAPVKPEIEPESQSGTAEDVTKSCLEHGRYVIRYWDEETEAWVYVTFACRPMFKSSQPPKPPEVQQDDYQGPESLSI